MKNILLILAVFITSSAFAQKTQKLEFSVGASLFAPITKNISFDDKAWGQRVQIVKPTDKQFAFVFNAGVQQDENQFLQIPLLIGSRHILYKNFYITYGTGATFMNKGNNPQFTITGGWGLNFNKFVIEQSIFRTTAGEKAVIPHTNNIGLSVLYKL